MPTARRWPPAEGRRSRKVSSMPERISGILPVHNEARVLGRVLDAIEQQTRRVDELIVVFDRCTDRSVEIAQGRAGRSVSVDLGNTAETVTAGIRAADGTHLVLFDGNTLVPREYVETVLQVLARTSADLVEWHGGMMGFPRSTLDRFGPFSARYLWTLEYFLRIQARGGTVVRLDGPHTRLTPSPLARNLRYGLDYADLAVVYPIPPYFRIGTKSGWVPDSVALLGAVLGHARHHRLARSVAQAGRYLRSP